MGMLRAYSACIVCWFGIQGVARRLAVPGLVNFGPSARAGGQDSTRLVFAWLRRGARNPGLGKQSGGKMENGTAWDGMGRLWNGQKVRNLQCLSALGRWDG